jgi:hypothetical protein
MKTLAKDKFARFHSPTISVLLLNKIGLPANSKHRDPGQATGLVLEGASTAIQACKSDYRNKMPRNFSQFPGNPIILNPTIVVFFPRHMSAFLT